MIGLAKSISNVLYEKGIIGHVTVDMVSFPNPADPNAHPLFWAVDLTAHLSVFASICSFFDILMEGTLDQQTGEYEIESIDDGTGANQAALRNDDDPMDLLNRIEKRKEPRNFMFCNFLHHPGLSTI